MSHGDAADHPAGQADQSAQSEEKVVYARTGSEPPSEGKGAPLEGTRDLGGERSQGEITGGVLDSLLSKYISVWLWSIVFGSISGLAFSLASYHGYERPSLLALLAAVPLILGMGGVILALLSLYRGLVDYLLPRFLFDKNPDPIYFFDMMRRAVAFLIITLVARLFLALFDLAFSALR
ncbi:MAG TPA: hypothetical protein VHG32_18625 [Thermoanaerobaculia bacterium]|jgi:hypothetical protein|nr:hypothetical protein [Thermoanaerobaculia bacterium]